MAIIFESALKMPNPPPPLVNVVSYSVSGLLGFRLAQLTTLTEGGGGI